MLKRNLLSTNSNRQWSAPMVIMRWLSLSMRMVNVFSLMISAYGHCMGVICSF